MTQPDPATGHDCGAMLREETARLGLDVIVTTIPPRVAGPYTTDAFTCPHGVDYWLEPTGEQIAQWVADGTP